MKILGVLALALVTAASLAFGLQGGQNLYLLTALPSPYGEATVTTLLWKVDNNRLAKVDEVSSEKAGSDFVAVDHDKRVLVVGTPSRGPSELVIINMDTPASHRTIPVTVASWSLRNALFVSHDTGLLFTVINPRNGTPKLLGIDLTTGLTSELPWQSYTGVRRDGWWTPGDGFNGNFAVNIKDEKLIGRVGDVATLDLEVAPPKNMAPEPGDFSLIVNTDAMLVLDRLSVRGKGRQGDPGKLQLEIYDKRERRWRTEYFNGGGSSVRSFQEWLVVCEGDVKRDVSSANPEQGANERQSTGADRRQKAINPNAGNREQRKIDDLFRESAAVFDGSVHFVNIHTGKRYRLDTGQGDTEVLLINGTTVYYRVNDTLFKAQIGENNIENTQQILRNDDVQLAHWAFLGQ